LIIPREELYNILFCRGYQEKMREMLDIAASQVDNNVRRQVRTCKHCCQPSGQYYLDPGENWCTLLPAKWTIMSGETRENWKALLPAKWTIMSGDR